MDLSKVRQAFETFAAQTEREREDTDKRLAELQENVTAAQTAAELAQLDAARDRSAKGEALTLLGEAQDALIAAEKKAAGRIAELEATNTMLARRDKESRDEHTRLRQILTKQNTERAK